MTITPRVGALALLALAIVACPACGGGGSGRGDAASVSAPIVLVRWHESVGAARYNVHWGTVSNVYTHTIDAGLPDVDAEGTVTTVVELEAAGEVYYFAVTAHDQNGQSSGCSNEIAVDLR